MNKVLIIFTGDEKDVLFQKALKRSKIYYDADYDNNFYFYNVEYNEFKSVEAILYFLEIVVINEEYYEAIKYII